MSEFIGTYIELPYIEGFSDVVGGGSDINKVKKNKPGSIKHRTTEYIVIDSIYDDRTISQKIYFCGCISVYESNNYTYAVSRKNIKCETHNGK